MKKSYFKYFTALLLFGSNGIIASYIHMNSYEIVFMRTLIGSLLLLLTCLFKRIRWSFYKYKKDFIFLILSGIAMGASWICLYEAYDQIGVSIASLCYYCGPVIVMVLSPLLFKEKLNAIKTIGFATVLLGIILVNIRALNENGDPWGIFYGLMSALMYSIMVICNKKSIRITGLENSTLQLSISFLTVAVFMFLKQGISLHISTGDILPILILGILNTGIGCFFYFSSVGNLPIQTVAICGYIEPLSAVIFSLIFLKETMSALQILGAALIIGGALISEIFKNRIDHNFAEKKFLI